MKITKRVIAALLALLLVCLCIYTYPAYALSLFSGLEVANSKEPPGAKVFGVAPESLASQVGIQPGDVIVTLGGQDIKSLEDFVNISKGLNDKERVTVSVNRRGERLEVVLDKKLTQPKDKQTVQPQPAPEPGKQGPRPPEIPYKTWEIPPAAPPPPPTPLTETEEKQLGDLEVKAKLDLTWAVRDSKNYSDSDHNRTSVSEHKSSVEIRARIAGQANISAYLVERPLSPDIPQFPGFSQSPGLFMPVGTFSLSADGEHFYRHEWSEWEQIFGDYIVHPQKYAKRKGWVEEISSDHCAGTKVFQGGRYITMHGRRLLDTSSDLLVRIEEPYHFVGEDKRPEKSSEDMLKYSIFFHTKADCTGTSTYRNDRGESSTGPGKWEGYKLVDIEIEGTFPKGQKTVVIKEENIKKHGFIMGYSFSHGDGLSVYDLRPVDVSGTLTFFEPGVRLNEAKDSREKICKEYTDKHCPDGYSIKQCYDIAVDFAKSELTIVIKVKTNKVKIVPPADVTTARTQQGEVNISVGEVTAGGKEPQPLEIPDDQLERLKDLWEMDIEGLWNGQFKLKRADGKETPVDVKFDVQFDAPGDSHQEVNVIPGEGRTDAGNWYAGGHGYAAHEFGHLLGLEDEYQDERCPNRPRAKDDNIMSDSQSAPKARHFKQFEDWLGKVTGTEWVITK